MDRTNLCNERLKVSESIFPYSNVKLLENSTCRSSLAHWSISLSPGSCWPRSKTPRKPSETKFETPNFRILAEKHRKLRKNNSDFFRLIFLHSFIWRLVSRQYQRCLWKKIVQPTRPVPADTLELVGNIEELLNVGIDCKERESRSSFRN